MNFKIFMPKNGNNGAMFVGTLGVGAVLEVDRGILIILGKILRLWAVDAISNIFVSVFGKKPIFLTTTGIGNGPNC